MYDRSEDRPVIINNTVKHFCRKELTDGSANYFALFWRTICCTCHWQRTDLLSTIKVHSYDVRMPLWRAVNSCVTEDHRFLILVNCRSCSSSEWALNMERIKYWLNMFPIHLQQKMFYSIGPWRLYSTRPSGVILGNWRRASRAWTAFRTPDPRSKWFSRSSIDLKRKNFGNTILNCPNSYFVECGKNALETVGLHHSSVDLSAPTIMRPQVWIPSTPRLLFQF